MNELRPDVNKDIKESIIYVWNGMMIFLGKATDVSMHQHHAILIAIGIDKKFRLKYSESWHRHRLVIIDADQPHQLDSGGLHALLLIEPETEVGKHIRKVLLCDSKIKVLDISAIDLFIDSLDQCLDQTCECEQARNVCNNIIDAITGEREKTDNIDPRIEKALEILSQSPGKKMSAKSLANSVHLSEDRLRHLFKEQVGIPVRRYLLWLRLIEAVDFISKGESLTTAAYAAGFADSAHLSRAFRRMFGMRLSNISKNSQFIQLITCQQFYT